MCTMKLSFLNREPVLRNTRKTPEKKTRHMWSKKYVETYSLSNAAAQYPKEKVN